MEVIIFLSESFWAGRDPVDNALIECSARLGKDGGCKLREEVVRRISDKP